MIHFAFLPGSSADCAQWHGQMCCIASEDISDGKRPMSLYTDTYEDIWNSTYMRDARRGLASGEKISPCRRCFDEEDAVGQSRRTTQNAAWLAKSDKSREELIEEARRNDWRVLDRPSYLQLNMGNLCNLACRMCSSQYSSKIENDPVHSKWMPAAHPEGCTARTKLHLGHGRFRRQLRRLLRLRGGCCSLRPGHPAWRWSGRREDKIHGPEGVAIEASACPVHGRVRHTGHCSVNGLEVFDGEFSVEWTKDLNSRASTTNPISR